MGGGEGGWVLNRHRFYSTPEWVVLRNKVRAKYRYVCQNCGVDCRGRNMNRVDHLIPRMQRPDLSLVESNLTLLCTHCHESTKKLWENNMHKTEIGEDGFPVGGDWG
jgi:5-methylcytosine-specific restriction endonuclease McrA